MNELLCHLIGDFCLQNQWMADRKRTKSFPCLVHVLLYTACFLTLTQDPKVLAIIGGTHFLIDRFSLANYWRDFYKIGVGTPDWLRNWLLIIVDNTFHLTINHLALLWGAGYFG